MKKIYVFLILITSIILLISCSQVYINDEKNIEIYVGDQHQLDIVSNDQQGLFYQSLDESVLVVSDQGLIEGLKVGVAVVVVTSKTNQNVFLEIEVTIKPKENETEPSEVIEPTYFIKDITIEIEEEFVLDDIPYENFKFEIENEEIVAINNLIISGEKIGKTIITVINLDNNESYEINVTVTEKMAKIEVIGNQNEKGIYTSEVTIKLSVDDQNKRIQYKIFTGVPSMEWETYRNPIEIKAKGAYGLLYRVVNRYGDENPGEQQRLNLILDFVMDETYTDVVRDGKIITYTDKTKITLPLYKEKDNEVRAIWVSTVNNIDISYYVSDESYKEKLITILDTIQANNLNTVFFQVRSMNDAFYPSEYAPYSRFIRGTEGLGLDWDILEFVIEEAHQRNLELHAWLNPYRVSGGGTADSPKSPKAAQLDRLHDDNFAKQNKHLVLADAHNNLILNPASQEVRDYLKAVINELLENYDIDGIHFDDYFYVDTDEDTSLYSTSNHNFDNIADWRRNNVNLMVKDISDLVRNHNKQKFDFVKFGISPAGIWANKNTPGGSPTAGYASYERPLYADTRKWVLEEWIDYIIPQVYWDFDNPLAPHADIVKWWANLIDDNDVDVALIIGQAMYRFSGTNPWTDGNAIVEQIRYASQYESVKGITFFTFRDILNPNANVSLTLSRLKDNFWTKPVDWPWASRLLESQTSGEAFIVSKNILQTEYDNATRIRGIVFDSEGKDPSQLESAKNYVETEYITFMDNALNEALELLNNPKATINMMNHMASILRKATQDIRENYFKGEKD